MSAKAGTDDGDELDVLATLVDAYEAEHFPIDSPDPIEAIKFRTEQMGLERKDLEPLIGSRARVAEILNRRRSLSLKMIRTLHKELDIPLEALIGKESQIYLVSLYAYNVYYVKLRFCSHKRPSTGSRLSDIEPRRS